MEIRLAEYIRQLSMLPESAKIEVSAHNSYDRKTFIIKTSIDCFTWNIKHKSILNKTIAKY